MVALRTALLALFFAVGLCPLPAWAGDPTKPVTLFESQIVECDYTAGGGGGNCLPVGGFAKVGADLSRGQVKVSLVNGFGSVRVQIAGATLNTVIQQNVTFHVFFGTSGGGVHLIGSLPPTDNQGETQEVFPVAFAPGSYSGLFAFTPDAPLTNGTLDPNAEVWYVSGFKVP